MAKTETLKFDPIEIQGVEFKTITIKAPNFKEVRTITSGIKFDEHGRPDMDAINTITERTLLTCGTSPNGPVIQELIDQLPYQIASKAGAFALSFM